MKKEELGLFLLLVLSCYTLCQTAKENDLFHCPEGWELQDRQCYRFFNIPRSWYKAAELCQRYGSELVLIKNYEQNNFTEHLAHLNLDGPTNSYWLGLMSLNDLTTNTLETPDQKHVSLYSGFWAYDQPMVSRGKCVKAHLGKEKQSWELNMCETLLPFMCEVQACAKNSKHCSNGRCISEAYRCDGQDDCGDMSDEMDCPNICNFYMKSSGDSLTSPRHPQKYDSNLNCKWTLEGPVGHSITLQFTQFDTEKNFDTVQILSGGRTEDSAYSIATLSGSPDLSKKLFVSASNFMIIRFKSDASVEKSGFRASWKTEPPVCGGELIAGNQAQTLTSPNYPQEYPGGLECLYIIKTQQGKVISLDIQDFDFEPENDFVLIRDGRRPSDPILAEMTGMLQDNPRFIISTGPIVYFYVHTHFGNARRGFKIKYTAGCTVVYTANEGRISSPAFGVRNYSSNLECTYLIRTPENRRLSLKFTDFEVMENDVIQIYDGNSTSNSIKLHPSTGLSQQNSPSIIFTAAENNMMYLRFTTDPIKNGRGWAANFSADCSVLSPGSGTIASSRDRSFGSVITFRCPIGEEFATNKTRIQTECGPGGSWSVDYIPDCQEVFCGPVPQIDNGFSIGATNVTYKGQATYQCYAGFKFPSDRSTETIVCRENGEWDSLPECMASQCPPLPETPNMNKNFLNGGGRSYGTVVRFECFPGFVRSGVPVVFCMSNGSWSGEVPTCSRIVCPKFPEGFVTDVSRQYYFGDEARVQCHRGFKLTGSAIIKCGPDQQFINVPKCEDVDECRIGECFSSSTECMNMPGSFFCKCKSGFSPKVECQPDGDLGLSDGGISESSIIVSSAAEGYEKNSVRLNSPSGWCGAEFFPNRNWVLVDLRVPTVITRLRIQPVGLHDGRLASATSIRLQYTDNLTDVMKDYTNTDGAPIEFQSRASTPSLISLPIPVEARYIKLILVDFIVAPCLKFELMGCSRQSCVDDNECEIDNGRCDHRCINLPGDYVCECNPGFVLYAENGTSGFNIPEIESGLKDGDIYRINKTCTPVMCPPLATLENGLILSTKSSYHYGDEIYFLCNFGYEMIGDEYVYCTSEGKWNGTIPECQPAVCGLLPEDVSDGLVYKHPNTEHNFIPFNENVTASCNSIGKPLRSTVTSNFRQCVYDPKPGLPNYWLSGRLPQCERVDCGEPTETPGARTGFSADTKYGSSFFFGCEDTFSFKGQTSQNSNEVTCQANGIWDFGDLRCEGPVCSDPGHPPDGRQIATSYEQGSRISFECSRPGFTEIPDDPIRCIKDPVCSVVKPIGISTGYIPDAAITAKTFRQNYEPHKLRLNSATGWCAQEGDVKLIQVDLGITYVITGMLLKGVVTNDIVGRPTKIKLYYKETPDGRYFEYFLNFNLTLTPEEAKSYGQVSSIIFPTVLKARFVSISILEYEVNPCMKMELLGCEDEPPQNRLMGYNIGYPVCVDDEPPEFANCPNHAIIVQRGPNGLEAVNFTVPTAYDNGGLLARWEVKPQGFKPPVYIFHDMEVEYTAFDFYGNVAICPIYITVPDVTPPVVKCPESRVLELLEEKDSYKVDFRIFLSEVKVSDNSGQPVTRSVMPEASVIRVGSFENVTVTATDVSGNTAMCTFHVAVKSAPCAISEFKSPANGSLDCERAIDSLRCTAYCNDGFRFTDNDNIKVFTCNKNDLWLPLSIVPDCVSKESHSASYDVIADVTFRANGAVQPTCLPQYNEFIVQQFESLNMQLSSRCSSGIGERITVTFKEADLDLIEENMVKIEFVMQISPEVKKPKLYAHCGTTLSVIYDITLDSSFEIMQSILDLPSVGSVCPPMVAVTSNVTSGFTCDTGEILNLEVSEIRQCLYCPAGTYAARKAAKCSLCVQGYYQDEIRQGSCKKCPAGTYTRNEGSKSILDCIPVCGFGTYSPEGFVPCLNCPPDTYAGPPPSGGFVECEPCPFGTFTYQEAAISQQMCRQKCAPGTYSDTGLEPCARCPPNYFQSNEGMTSCFECPPNSVTAGNGASSEAQCQTLECESSRCQNGGLCLSRHHQMQCYCPAGFSGEFCEIDLDDCASIPCYNGGTCIDQPQGYVCECLEGYRGLQCQDETGDCIDGACPDRAMCKDNPGRDNFECLCRSGYTGHGCNITVDPCTEHGNPCANNGQCTALEQGRFYCTCLPGWEGSLCDININDCEEQPCLLRANCTDLVNDFKCDCPNGFTGKRCHVKVDLCADLPCLNGLCIDTFFDYNCICSPGWTGELCDININECARNPCENEAQCMDKENDYVCSCPIGYTGKNCQHTIDDCSIQPCQNGGTCIDEIEGFQCLCRPGYVSLQCEVDIDECIDNACSLEGTEECLNLDNKYECKCRTGYIGEFCEINTDECSSNPCLNNAACVDGIADFACVCEPGWTGKRCEDDIGTCAESPCLNDATCIDLFEDYFCVCPSGTDGKRCQIAPDRCVGSPCMNGAMCQDFGSGLNCTCSLDYTGVGCQYEFDACEEGICQNGATCVDNGSGYECHCPPGYAGRNCEKDIQNCLSSSCPPGSTCIDLIDNFYCKCPFNLTGEDCRKGIAVELFEDMKTFINFRKNIPINEGQWHHIAFVWDGGNNRMIVTTDAVVVSQIDHMADFQNMTLPSYGWITLGSVDEEHATYTNELGFHGRITRVNMWNRPLDFRADIPRMVLSCTDSPVMFNGLLLRWSGYERIIGNVERIGPSTCGKRVCPPGYSDDCNVLERDKSPPRVDNCPGDIWVITRNGTATVQWEDVLFSDNVAVTRVEDYSGYSSGQVFSLGTYTIARVAYDAAGNSATCSFEIHVLEEFCPDLADPVGGIQRCSDWGPGGRFKVCMIECNDGMAFSTKVPRFYTCGAEGFWRPTTDPSIPLVYPVCAPSIPAQRVFKIKMQFQTSHICNVAGQNVLNEKIRNAINKLNSQWSICTKTEISSGECNDLNINVDCSRRSRVVRQATSGIPSPISDDVYDVEIAFPSTSDPVRGRSPDFETTVRRLIEGIILEQDEFNVRDELPNVVPDPSSLVLDSSYLCPVGKVVVDDKCVDCSSGTYYDREAKICRTCESGTYQDEMGQVACKSCPQSFGRPMVTEVPGARSADDCKARCAAGLYFDKEKNSCQSCGYGYYQPDEGKFSCLRCERGLTTHTPEAIDKSQCKEECESGLQLSNVGDNCVPCPRGTYRTKGVHTACVSCPVGKYTRTPGASAIDECSIPICTAGQFLVEENSEFKCLSCNIGYYQPDANQEKCIKCPADTSTTEKGSTDISQCTNPCEVEGRSFCDPNAHCVISEDSSRLECICKTGFNGTGDKCTDNCEDYCYNNGKCKKDNTGIAFCECTGSFVGLRCEKKSQFAYIVGGVAGGVFIAILLVLLIWMICIRATKRREPKKLLPPTSTDPNGSQVNFYYGAPAPYAESIAPSHHSTYAHYYDDEEDAWEMPNFYNETYMKTGYPNPATNSLARSNASMYGNKEELYDRLRKHAYTGKKEKDETPDSDDQGR